MLITDCWGFLCHVEVNINNSIAFILITGNIIFRFVFVHLCIVLLSFFTFLSMIKAHLILLTLPLFWLHPAFLFCTFGLHNRLFYPHKIKGHSQEPPKKCRLCLQSDRNGPNEHVWERCTRCAVNTYTAGERNRPRWERKNAASEWESVVKERGGGVTEGAPTPRTSTPPASESTQPQLQPLLPFFFLLLRSLPKSHYLSLAPGCVGQSRASLRLPSPALSSRLSQQESSELPGAEREIEGGRVARSRGGSSPRRHGTFTQGDYSGSSVRRETEKPIREENLNFTQAKDEGKKKQNRGENKEALSLFFYIFFF